MAVDFVAAGTTVASIDALTVTWPGTQSEGDVALLFLETVWTDTVSVSGWTELASSPQGTAAGAHKLSVFRKVVGASESSVSIADPGNHGIAQILVFSGVDTTTPINASSGYSDTSALTALTIPAVTTTEADCAIVHIAGTGRDINSTSNFSGWANTNLTSITEIANATTALANGGGFGAAWGILSTAGSSGDATVTQGAAITWSGITVALTPASGGGGTEYTITVSGGATFSGTSVISLETNIPISGSIVFTGTNLVIPTYVIPVTGNIAYSGTASVTVTNGSTEYTITPTGNITYSGTNLVLTNYTFDVSGTLTLSGTTTPLNIRTITPDGYILFSGDSMWTNTTVLVPTGNITFSGYGNLFIPGDGTVTTRLPLTGVGV